MESVKNELGTSRVWLLVIALLLVIIVSGPFLAIGIWESAENISRDRSWITTDGIVTGNTYRATIGEGASYFPQVDFKTGEGEEVHFTDGVGSAPPDYQAGDKVNVIYDPDKPKDARIRTWKRMWLVPTIFLVIGLLLLVLLTVAFLFLSKKTGGG